MWIRKLLLALAALMVSGLPASADGPPPLLLPQVPEQINVFESYIHLVPVKQRNGQTQLVLWGGVESGDSTRFREALALVPRPISEILILGSPGGVLEEGLEIGRMIHQAKLAVRIPTRSGHLIGKCVSACNFIFLGGLIRTIDVGGEFIVHLFHLDIAPTFLLSDAVAASEGLEPTPSQESTKVSSMAPTASDIVSKISAPKHLGSLGCDLDRIYTARYDRQVQVQEIAFETGKSPDDVDLEKDTIQSPRHFAQLRAMTIDYLCLEQSTAVQAAEVAQFLIEMRMSMRFLTAFANIGNALPVPMTRDELRSYNITNTD